MSKPHTQTPTNQLERINDYCIALEIHHMNIREIADDHGAGRLSLAQLITSVDAERHRFLIFSLDERAQSNFSRLLTETMTRRSKPNTKANPS